MKRISIIIGFTPYHAHAAKPILERVVGSVYCVFTKVWPSVERSYIRIGPPESWPVPGRGILTFLHFAVVVRCLIARGCPIDVYIPHPGHIFTNYLFFAPIPRKRLFVYEDGLLNYYDADVNNTFVSRTKRLLAHFGGLRYRDYAGHLAGYDVGIYDGAYLSMPEKAVRKDRLGTLHRLSFETQVVALQLNTILFLDQDISSRMSLQEREHCLATMLANYPAKEYRYHYKSHHDHTSKLAETMLPLAPNLRSMPAEMLMEHLRPSHVISFFSSALINIKNFWPNVECVSLAASQVTITRDGKQSSLQELFQNVGVKCL